MKVNTDCRLFSGYKPCEPYRLCSSCDEPEPFGKKILVISLDAMGNVLQNTGMLPSLKDKYSECTIYWLTMPESFQLLRHNPDIFKIFLWNSTDLEAVKEMEFDLCINTDKSQYACALMNRIKASEKKGFRLNANGQIVQINEEAEYLYRMGIDDQLKFRENQRSGIEITTTAMGLKYQRKPYKIYLTDEEKEFVRDYRVGLLTELTIGINTGCSELFPNKKLNIPSHIELVKMLLEKYPQSKVLLLGGKAETERNRRIAEEVNHPRLVNTPTTEGLRKGILYLAASDVLITGDTLALHIGIALERFVVAWFGLSCGQEIDVFGKGIKIVSEVDCAPCWKKQCSKGLVCIKELNLEKIADSVQQIF